MSLRENGIRWYFRDLIYGIRIERIRERDAAGTLTATGLKWRQFSDARGAAALFFIVVGIGIIATPFYTGHGFSAGWTAIGLLSMSIGGFFLEGVFRKREIRFMRDGAILTPHGFPGFPRRKTMEGTHRNVVSIELGRPRSEQDAWGHRVELYGAGGEVVWLAAKLDEYDARKVMVQLNQALIEIRESARPEDPVSASTAARQWGNYSGPGIGG